MRDFYRHSLKNLEEWGMAASNLGLLAPLYAHLAGEDAAAAGPSGSGAKAGAVRPPHPASAVQVCSPVLVISPPGCV